MIEKILTISDVHVKESTYDCLHEMRYDTIKEYLISYDESDRLMIYKNSDRGYFIRIPSNFKTSGISLDLDECIEYAIKNGCTWLRIDVFGDEIDELTFY